MSFFIFVISLPITSFSFFFWFQVPNWNQLYNNWFISVPVEHNSLESILICIRPIINLTEQWVPRWNQIPQNQLNLISIYYYYFFFKCRIASKLHCTLLLTFRLVIQSLHSTSNTCLFVYFFVVFTVPI